MKPERITMERTFQATLQEVWELWTTKDGLESWWGPDGFRVEVRSIDLRPGGLLLYAMIADSPEALAVMKRQGMPALTEARITFREIVPQQRLAYSHLADFIPGVAAYDVETVVTLEEADAAVKMTLRFDRMHDETWTQRAAAGWKMELDRLEKETGPMKPSSSRPTVHVSIDVPDLAAGLRFYEAIFGFVEIARPFPTMAVLDANNVTVCMHQKAPGTKPAPTAPDARRYERHWTPVHVDLHVHDFDGTLAKLRAAGGVIENEFRNHGPMPTAFCSDPFGNGFCVIGERAA